MAGSLWELMKHTVYYYWAFYNETFYFSRIDNEFKARDANLEAQRELAAL